MIKETDEGNNVVIIIDEAQNLSIKQLEQVRLLSNLETEKEKLLQIILVGQPELCDKLKLKSLRQLNQRVSVRYHVNPLSPEELSCYIKHRLKVAELPGNNGDIKKRPYFTKDAIDAIYKSSQGTPRVANMLCDRALLAGFTSSQNKIDEYIIQKCIEEVVC